MVNPQDPGITTTSNYTEHNRLQERKSETEIQVEDIVCAIAKSKDNTAVGCDKIAAYKRKIIRKIILLAPQSPNTQYQILIHFRVHLMSFI